VADEKEKDNLNVTTAVADTGTWEKKINVTVAPEDVGREYNTVIGGFSGHVNLPGFRPGKVPRDVIEKRFGTEIRKQVTANLLERAIQTAVEKENLKIVGDPEFDEPEKILVSKGQPFSFEFKAEIFPQFELPPYTGLKAEQEEIEVLPEEMEQALNSIRERMAEEAPAEEGHAIGERDSATGVLRVLVDGAEVHKEDAAQLLVVDGHVFGGYAHLGANYLTGAKVGEKRAVEETLAGNFPVEAHRGKKATIEFEVKSIKLLRLPPIDDELAKKVEVADVQALKEKVRSSLIEKIGETIRNRTRDNILHQVIDNSKFELPARTLARAASANMTESVNYLARMGVSPEAVGLTPEAMASKSRSGGEAELRRFFVLAAIAEKEKITAEEEEVDEIIVGMARRQGVPAQQLFDRLAEEGQIGQLEMDIRFRKTIEFLMDSAEIAVVPRKPAEKMGGHEHPEHAPGHAHEHEHAEQAPEHAEHAHGHDEFGHEHAEHGHEHAEHGHEHGEHGHDHGEHGHEHGGHSHEHGH
jgi:trigger factor